MSRPRITQRQLEALVDRLNRAAHAPVETVKRDANGKLQWQIDNYHISGAYGGVSLHQIVGDSGGTRDVFSCGHVPKRELYNRIHSMLIGMEASK